MGQVEDEIRIDAEDALGAIEGVRRLREWGLPVLGLSGVLTASPLAMAETRSTVDLPIYLSTEIFDAGRGGASLLSDPDTAIGLLRAVDGRNNLA